MGFGLALTKKAVKRFNHGSLRPLWKRELLWSQRWLWKSVSARNESSIRSPHTRTDCHRFGDQAITLVVKKVVIAQSLTPELSFLRGAHSKAARHARSSIDAHRRRCSRTTAP